MQASARLLIVFIFLSNFNSVGQVLNAEFENWTIKNGIEEPDFWSSNNITNSISIEKTTDKHAGNYAISVSSNLYHFEGLMPGEAYSFFDPTGVDTLYAWVKCDSLISPAEGVIELWSYKSGSSPFLLNKYTFPQAKNNYEWVKIVVPNVPSDSIGIFIIAETKDITGLGYDGYVRLKVDNIYTNLTVGIAENAGYKMRLFPNPVKDVLKIEIGETAIIKGDVEIVNMYGEIVFTGVVSETSSTIDIRSLASGEYILKFVLDGYQYRKKFVKVE